MKGATIALTRVYELPEKEALPMEKISSQNQTTKSILLNALMAAVSLFVNGFGIYLTMRADIGASPWDVFNLGISGTVGILYGTASIMVSVTILVIDILMKEPVGIAMFIDSIVVGKSVDLFNYLDLVPIPKTLFGSVLLMLTGLFIMGYTQCFYMKAALGCGPRDTLLVGLKRRLPKIPIGVVSMIMLSVVTLIGFLLGGPVGIGTIICALFSGPIMQFSFRTLGFDATSVHHQDVARTLEIWFGDLNKKLRN